MDCQTVGLDEQLAFMPGPGKEDKQGRYTSSRTGGLYAGGSERKYASGGGHKHDGELECQTIKNQ